MYIVPMSQRNAIIVDLMICISKEVCWDDILFEPLALELDEHK